MINWFIKHFLNNIRSGFATNSSSSHSMVFYDDPVCSESSDVSYMDTEFGWNNFRLASLGEKLMYALVTLMSSTGYSWYDDAEKWLPGFYDEYRELFPEFSYEDFENAARGYIDHQSINPDPEVILRAARDPRIVFEGGNDNDYGHTYDRDDVVYMDSAGMWNLP